MQNRIIYKKYVSSLQNCKNSSKNKIKKFLKKIKKRLEFLKKV